MNAKKYASSNIPVLTCDNLCTMLVIYNVPDVNVMIGTLSLYMFFSKSKMAAMLAGKQVVVSYWPH